MSWYTMFCDKIAVFSEKKNENNEKKKKRKWCTLI